jgi:hypothetical protein
MRRTLFSDVPRSSDAPSEPAPASGVEAGPTDFGRWLTHDLRPKGAPSQPPPEARPSQPPPVVIPVPEQAELANWLLRDLRPRSGAPPDAGVRIDPLLALRAPHSREPVLPAEVLPAEALSVEVAPDSLPPPDSLMPHAVSEAPLALVGSAEPALDDDDLSVLPSRRGKPEHRRRRALLLLAALVGVAGLSLWLRSGGQSQGTQGAEPVLAAPLATAPLPPPPPVLVEEEEPEITLPAPTLAHRSSAAVDPADDDETAPGFRGRRAGDAIARFADLPLSTQAKLAREERQKARSREASARARKSSKSSLP